MRQAAKQINRGQTSRTLSVPSPVGGWNARDALAEMAPKDAVSLDNFFCTPFDVTVRYGYSTQTSGISGTVNTLASYSPPSGSIKLFAWSGANVYDASSTGVVGSPVISGLSSDKWQYINFGTSGGQFMVAADGTDSPLVYNGSQWGNIGGAAFNTTVSTLTSVGTTATCTMSVAHGLKTGMSITISGFTPAGYNGTYVITVTSTTAFTFTLSGALGVVTVTGTATPPAFFAVTGVTPTLLIQPAMFASRLWFIERAALRAWYMPVLSIGGAAQPVDLSSVFSRGGYLMAMGTWSLDAGYGMDDYVVFVSSEGQVAVYKGIDPASSSTWARIGIYDIGAPIGRRCLMKYAGDLTVISKDGLAPLSKALMSSRVNSQEMLTDKIQHIMSDYTTTYGANFGWETSIFPQENMLLVNVPISSTQSYQLVMNTISGAWSRFTGWNAACFELHGDQLYFGGVGGVFKAWDTQADNGNNISFEAQQSFNYFGSQGQLKQVKMLRPILSIDGNASVLLGVNTDFDTTAPTGVPTFTPTNYAAWDAATWDGGFVWGGDLQIKRDWQTAFGLGYCISAHMKGTSKGTKLRWASTDYVLQAGGVV